MNVLFLILLNVIFPVFLLIGVGVLLHRTFKFDLNTLSKINTYFLLPTVSFVNIYQSDLAGGTLLHIVGFLMLQSCCLIVISIGVSRTAGFNRSLSSTFTNSVVLYNSGNFGLPVSQLVFHNNPIGLSVQVIVTIYQNLLTNTFGLANAVSAQSQGNKMVKELLKNPIVYAFLLGLGLKALKVPIPTFLWSPIQNVSNAFLAIALITLGAQSAYLRFNRISLPLAMSLIGRLLVSPAIALCLIWALRLEGTAAQALFIASSYPTSRNSAVFALEYGNDPEYAAQTVLLSTFLSSMTVAAVVYASKLLFA
ncbi:AEC family transporter [Paenibacillus sp. UNC451MF]|uniref:AEC family transporter n=1 Tax=Paenibacillus sp. UNC451MF TaxID=1449063 RepID=UPI00048F5744|nr:AEC family transporter [Paenibacillus sp. UNC451MF]